jgi:hypothetical protein
MSHAPSIVPEDPDREVYLVLDDFGGRLGSAWRETEPADTELEHLIENLLAGQYSNPLRRPSTPPRAGHAMLPKRSPVSSANAAASVAKCQHHCRNSWRIMGGSRIRNFRPQCLSLEHAKHF